MQDFPHRYHASAAAGPRGDIPLLSSGLPVLQTASPPEFGGPGDRWSPETMLTGAVANCFILTFRAVAAASKLDWTDLRCEVTGTLDRVDRVTQFTGFDLVAQLSVRDGTNRELAHRVLEKAERNCLVSNSLKGVVRLQAVVVSEEHQPAFG